MKLEEMTPEKIRQEVQEAYPELACFLHTAVEALYAAIWFGTLTPTLCGFQSATGQFMKDHKLPSAPAVKVIDALAGLVLAAGDDAYYECLIAGAEYELEDLPHVPRCGRCHGIVKVDCLCEGGPMLGS